MGFQPPHFPQTFPTGNAAPMFWPQGGPVENGKQSNCSEFPPFKKPRNFEEPPSMGSNFQNQGVMMNQGRMMMPPPPPPQNPNQNAPLGKIFFKTRLCGKFEAGHCPYGNNCSYAHGVEEMRPSPPNWQRAVASREENQSVLKTGANCEEDQKLISKFRLCKKFCIRQACPYGDNCNFVHRYIEDCREESRFRESSSISIGTTGPPGGNVATLSRPDQPYGSDKHQFAHGPAVVTGSTAMDFAKFIPNPNDAANVNAAVVSTKKQVVVAKILNWDTKKLSRIYADWIEPPRSPTNVES
ncbi:hypothetical protein MKW94_027223 [Papaver nudicaule]|uniref:C3H1-type domain-containing protein n=1 Tax=Papaver nudicaule TaxID=74823 RepID=A0AA41UUG8_PAPNU|nr:hypothetical protein [Papaver nudicaule]